MHMTFTRTINGKNTVNMPRLIRILQSAQIYKQEGILLFMTLCRQTQ